MQMFIMTLSLHQLSVGPATKIISRHFCNIYTFKQNAREFIILYIHLQAKLEPTLIN
jgi:hypothetical protein